MKTKTNILYEAPSLKCFEVRIDVTLCGSPYRTSPALRDVGQGEAGDDWLN